MTTQRMSELSNSKIFTAEMLSTMQMEDLHLICRHMDIPTHRHYMAEKTKTELGEDLFDKMVNFSSVHDSEGVLIFELTASDESRDRFIEYVKTAKLQDLYRWCADRRVPSLKIGEDDKTREELTYNILNI